MVAINKQHINEQSGAGKEPAWRMCFSAERILIANTRGWWVILAYRPVYKEIHEEWGWFNQREENMEKKKMKRRKKPGGRLGGEGGWLYSNCYIYTYQQFHCTLLFWVCRGFLHRRWRIYHNWRRRIPVHPSCRFAARNDPEQRSSGCCLSL